MITLFLGDDAPAKDARIQDIRTRLFPAAGARHFDYEVLHGHKLSPGDLKKALLNLPGLGTKRLVVIRECHRLSPQNRDLLAAYAKDRLSHCVLVLDSDVWEKKDAFVRDMSARAEVVHFGRKRNASVFDLTDAIAARRGTKALKLLAQLLEQGDHPLKILGGIGWFWGTMKGKVSVEDFESGLRSLREADVNIKRSRVQPAHALEIAVVRLCE